MAVKESQDFIPADGRFEADLDLLTIIGGHRTPLLKGISLSGVQPLSAVQRYLTYAQEQLAAAAGHEVAGSMALCAIGQVHAALAAQKNPDVPAAAPKAVVFFQAAILACLQNHLAFNELGVLLARNGNYPAAQRALEQSNAIRPTAASLANLAVVYQQLGQPQLAEAVSARSRAVAAEEAARRKDLQLSAGGLVQWVSPPTLAQSSGQMAEGGPPKAAAADQSTTASPPARENVGWWPWPHSTTER
jgi:tetratricopeptide (TPR) repeat protein